MINVTKSFYPVGQGGFYSERILYNGNPVVFVYDCGSVIGSSKSGPTNELKKSILNSGLNSVCLVVISHLDEDHVNGIPELEKYLNSISSKPLPLIFIPRPTPFDLLLFYKKASTSSISWFLRAVNIDKRIVFIDSGKNDDLPGDCILKDESVKIDDMIAGKTVSQKKIFSLIWSGNSNAVWKLKFFVDRGKFVKLKRDEVKTVESIKSIDDYEKSKGRLKGIYRNVRYGMNGSSMSMVSFPQVADPENAKINFSEAYITWLNGDALLKTDAEIQSIEEHFNEVFAFNVDFQIPHHGSHHNLECFPRNLKNIRTYIWAGFQNGYGHPSGTILNMIKANGFECNWITEKTNRPIVRHETWFIK